MSDNSANEIAIEILEELQKNADIIAYKYTDIAGNNLYAILEEAKKHFVN